MIEDVEFVGSVPSVHTWCREAMDVTHRFVLKCNGANGAEELTPRTPDIASGCPPAVLVLIILCVLLAFIAIVLYAKLRKANQMHTANGER